VRLGQVPTTCPQLDGFGVTGTPAIDTGTRAVYLADARGRLHALGLDDGREQAGWPMTLYDDPQRELVWGAIALVRGTLYVPTGSICDRRIEGKVIRVDPATGAVSSWRAVPFELGGGGGIWGWGGVAYSERLDSLLVVTGNALRGGANVGGRFSEAAGYGEQLVELDRDLAVRSASHPEDITAARDLDFVGSPLVGMRAGCGEVVAATNKNGVVYGWRSDRISDGPLWSVVLRGRRSLPLISQPAWAAATGSFVVASAARLTRVDVTYRLPRQRGMVAGGGRSVEQLTDDRGPNDLVRPERADRSRAEGRRSPHGPRLISARLPHVAFVAPTFVGRRI
jgi:hypothetical protein